MGKISIPFSGHTSAQINDLVEISARKCSITVQGAVQQEKYLIIKKLSRAERLVEKINIHSKAKNKRLKASENSIREFGVAMNRELNKHLKKYPHIKYFCGVSRDAKELKSALVDLNLNNLAQALSEYRGALEEVEKMARSKRTADRAQLHDSSTESGPMMVKAHRSRRAGAKKMLMLKPVKRFERENSPYEKVAGIKPKTIEQAYKSYFNIQSRLGALNEIDQRELSPEKMNAFVAERDYLAEAFICAQDLIASDVGGPAWLRAQQGASRTLALTQQLASPETPPSRSSSISEADGSEIDGSISSDLTDSAVERALNKLVGGSDAEPQEPAREGLVPSYSNGTLHAAAQALERFAPKIS